MKSIYLKSFCLFTVLASTNLFGAAVAFSPSRNCLRAFVWGEYSRLHWYTMKSMALRLKGITEEYGRPIESNRYIVSDALDKFRQDYGQNRTQLENFKLLEPYVNAIQELPLEKRITAYLELADEINTAVDKNGKHYVVNEETYRILAVILFYARSDVLITSNSDVFQEKYYVQIRNLATTAYILSIQDELRYGDYEKGMVNRLENLTSGTELLKKRDYLEVFNYAYQVILNIDTNIHYGVDKENSDFEANQIKYMHERFNTVGVANALKDIGHEIMTNVLAEKRNNFDFSPLAKKLREAFFIVPKLKEMLQDDPFINTYLSDALKAEANE